MAPGVASLLGFHPGLNLFVQDQLVVLCNMEAVLHAVVGDDHGLGPAEDLFRTNLPDGILPGGLCFP
jgi:hypothetical protein